MDGWEIENIKTHRCNVGKTLLAITPRAVLARLSGAGAGKEFVPGTAACFAAVDADAQFFIVSDCPAPLRILFHQRRQLCVQSSLARLGAFPQQIDGKLLQ
jgi:hypothetical protein